MSTKSDGKQFLLNIKPKYRKSVTPILQILKENREASDFVCQAILEKVQRDGIPSAEVQVEHLLNHSSVATMRAYVSSFPKSEVAIPPSQEMVPDAKVVSQQPQTTEKEAEEIKINVNGKELEATEQAIDSNAPVRNEQEDEDTADKETDMERKTEIREEKTSTIGSSLFNMED